MAHLKGTRILKEKMCSLKFWLLPGSPFKGLSSSSCGVKKSSLYTSQPDTEKFSTKISTSLEVYLLGASFKKKKTIELQNKNAFVTAAIANPDPLRERKCFHFFLLRFAISVFGTCKISFLRDKRQRVYWIFRRLKRRRKKRVTRNRKGKKL